MIRELFALTLFIAACGERESSEPDGAVESGAPACVGYRCVCVDGGVSDVAIPDSCVDAKASVEAACKVECAQ